jgi:hypothetical protein
LGEFSRKDFNPSTINVLPETNDPRLTAGRVLSETSLLPRIHDFDILNESPILGIAGEDMPSGY